MSNKSAATTDVAQYIILTDKLIKEQSELIELLKEADGIRLKENIQALWKHYEKKCDDLEKLYALDLKFRGDELSNKKKEMIEKANEKLQNYHVIKDDSILQTIRDDKEFISELQNVMSEIGIREIAVDQMQNEREPNVADLRNKVENFDYDNPAKIVSALKKVADQTSIIEEKFEKLRTSYESYISKLNNMKSQEQGNSDYTEQKVLISTNYVLKEIDKSVNHEQIESHKLFEMYEEACKLSAQRYEINNEYPLLLEEIKSRLNKMGLDENGKLADNKEDIYQNPVETKVRYVGSNSLNNIKRKSFKELSNRELTGKLAKVMERDKEVDEEFYCLIKELSQNVIKDNQNQKGRESRETLKKEILAKILSDKHKIGRISPDNKLDQDFWQQTRGLEG